VGSVFLRLGFTGVLIAGIAVARERKFLRFTIALLAANLCVLWLAGFVTEDEVGRQLFRHAFGAAYLLYLVVVLCRTLFREGEATLDTVLGGINVYLLLGIAFLQMHLFVERFAPGSYARAGLALSDPESHPYGSLTTTLFYFSFTTLTTLGYGDVAPAKPISEFLAIAEAVIGQLYVAIFIGGLVALRIGALQRPAPERR